MHLLEKLYYLARADWRGYTVCLPRFAWVVLYYLLVPTSEPNHYLNEFYRQICPWKKIQWNLKFYRKKTNLKNTTSMCENLIVRNCTTLCIAEEYTGLIWICVYLILLLHIFYQWYEVTQSIWPWCLSSFHAATRFICVMCNYHYHMEAGINYTHEESDIVTCICTKECISFYS